MIDTVKLKLYYEVIRNQIYSEGDSAYHHDLTTKVINDYIEPLKISKKSQILDIGCGPGYFLDEMKKRGYDHCVGITASQDDIDMCREKGLTVKTGDISFLKEADESQDLIFCRHCLEHSPWPYITLMEYNRVLKQNGYIYIEMPAPDNQRPHEYNKNHYSIMGMKMIAALLDRSGFDPVENLTMTVTLKQEDTGELIPESYYVMIWRKQRPIDIK